jgi:hypothetical protein
VSRYAEYGYELPGGVHPSSGSVSQASFADSPDPGVAFMRDGAFSGPEASVLPENPAETTALGSGSGPRQLVAIIDAERAAHAVRMNELEGILVAERDAFVARIRELERTVDSERAAYGALIANLRATSDAERQAAVARIRELEATLKAEHDAFVARIRQLERR